MGAWPYRVKASLRAWAAEEPGLRATLAWAAVATMLLSLPETAAWDAIIGNSLGETGNHLWMFWRASERMVGVTGALGNAPAGVPVPLMDPINLPFYLMGAWLSPGVGWRLMVWGNLLLSMAGGYALARQLTSAAGARVAMVACASAPFLGGVLDFGITESWPLGWMSLHVALLVHHARSGNRWSAVGAGLTLGAVALSGWYHAFYGLVIEALVVVPLLMWKRRLGLVWQGGIGLLMVLPALWAFLPVHGQWEPRWRTPSPGPPGPRPDWGELPVFGVDLLTLVMPHPDVVSPSKATYLGLVVLLLALLAVVRRPLVGLPLVGLAVPFLVLSLGYWPSIGGKAWGFPGPAKSLVDSFPALTGMSHWFRAVGPATVFLGVAAGVGAGVVCRRLVWSHIIVVLVLLDAIVASPTAWPRAAFVLEVPASIEMLAGEGGLVQLPFDNGRREFSEAAPRQYNLWQVGHGRPVSENYEGMDALLATSHLVAPIDAACLLSTTLPPYYQPPPEMRGRGTPSKKNAAPMVETLADQGFDWIVLHRNRCPSPVTPIRALDKVLGRGLDLPGGDRAWPLRDGLRMETEALLAD